ncbi:MAG: LpxI family protein, partial [Phycisphaerales bacterium]|nr:LpxI family protein [Phycisphaerales bacterium]
YYLRARHDRRSPALLAAVADELLSGGVRLIDSTTHIADHMATEGVMGSVVPSPEVRRDVEFGWRVLLESSRLGIGQCIAVRDRDVLAVEAIEGTDAMIERAGTLCRAGGWTMLKTAGPSHDMRADVPTVGVQTIERLARSRARAIALGVARVILIDRPAVLAAADRAGIAVIGVQDVERAAASAGRVP